MSRRSLSEIESLGECIRHARRRRGLSQAELAAAVGGVSTKTVGRIERAQVRESPSVPKLLSYLGLPPELEVGLRWPICSESPAGSAPPSSPPPADRLLAEATVAETEWHLLELWRTCAEHGGDCVDEKPTRVIRRDRRRHYSDVVQ